MSVDFEQQQHQQTEGNYCFKWNDYENHLSALARQLLDEDSLVDVTISVAGERFKAHRIILSACSTLFQEILSETKEDHPTIIISDISPQDVKSIVEFAYYGEVRIPVDNICNLLEAAHSLRISGLMEVEGLDENETINAKETLDDSLDIIKLETQEYTDTDLIQSFEGSCEIMEESVELNDIDQEQDTMKKKKRRKEYSKREYNEKMLESAILDLKSGQSLVEAATNHGIPRSTLYMRAKAMGIQLQASRNEYSAESMRSAINEVLNGSSLQHASEIFKIPKTVLWRRIQKEGYQILRTEEKRKYGFERREAAVKALQRGENLTKVSQEYQIPKTTLFRDKARLVDEGKLPLSCWRKRKTENEDMKKSRLEEAVAACRGGKMSQAAAAIAYRIPKTTIWRKLQLENQRTGMVLKKKRRKSENISNDTLDKSGEKEDFPLCEVPSDIPIYLDDNCVPESSVIILADGVGMLESEVDRDIVKTKPEPEFVQCESIDLDVRSSNFTTVES